MDPADGLVRSLPDAIVTLEESGEIRGWLGAADRLFGWSASETVGRNVNELLRPRLGTGEPAVMPDPGPARTSLEKVLPGHAEGPGELERELLVTAKDGSQVWVGVCYGRTSNSQPGRAQTVAAIRDIRHRKSVDLAKSEVISSVAHELRSPLTSIKGFAATLVKRWDNFEESRRKEILATIESDADRVTRLIAELLDLSRLEEGRLQLHKQPVDLTRIAERVAERIREEALNHSLEVDFSPGLPPVMADPDKVEQVLTNLLENAVKYTEQGLVRVSGEVQESSIVVSVADEGTGIPVQHRQDVFRKFYRKAGEGTPLPPGSGLGLYISKGLIEAHGGAIWADEAPGGGALFAFTLPVDRAGSRR